MADKLSDKEIERRKQQAALNAAAPKPHENFVQAKAANFQTAQGPDACVTGAAKRNARSLGIAGAGA